ncbi:MAG: acyl-CoA dehydrogenase [Chitinophagaceae bacterium]|nr:MAG: acyl-CoA dehydrogenase [Chitinophagaceae bacterium]
MSAYYFSEEHEMFRQGLKDFLKKEVEPHIDEWEANERIPKSIWKKFGEMGYMGLNFPEELGGSDVDFFYSVVFCEEVSKLFSGGFAAAATVIQFMSAPYIFKHGSDFLKEKYLKPTIAGEMVSAIGITEPIAGSDVANIRTTAKKEGDFYIVNGQKTFITNGVYGDYIVTVVKTDTEAGFNGFSLIVIDREAEGVSAKKLKKLGWHASDTAELWFDNVKVPAENLIGEEGQGFVYLMGGLQLERLMGSVGAIAASEASIEYSMKYMNEREAFGRKINRFQVLRHNLVQLVAEVESLKFYNYHCCRMFNDGKYAVKESSISKLLCTELSNKVAYECLQFLGGYGYMEEYKMARMYRDSRILTIGGGSSEIMREILAKMIIDEKQYKDSGLSIKYKKSKTEETNLHNSNNQKQTSMAFDKILEAISTRAKSANALENTLKFDFGDKQIHIDGTEGENLVTTENKEADCTIKITQEDFEAILSGDLNPMGAFMSGKFKVDGDLGVAMKLQSLLG